MLTYKVSDNFNYNEFVCGCCERLKLTDRFYRHIELLEQIRAEYGAPILINSGYRCPIHNQAVGGATNSQHLIFATDITPKMGHDEDVFLVDVMKLRELALSCGFNGIGLYNTFIHIDLRSGIPKYWDNRTINLL